MIGFEKSATVHNSIFDHDLRTFQSLSIGERTASVRNALATCMGKKTKDGERKIKPELEIVVPSPGEAIHIGSRLGPNGELVVTDIKIIGFEEKKPEGKN